MVLHNNVQVPIEPSVIQRCHRLGAVRRNGQCRPLIVRFVSYKTRREVLQNKKRLKNTAPQISITENLTRTNLELFRQARKCGLFERVWTADGTVLALTNSGVVRLTSLDDVRNHGK